MKKFFCLIILTLFINSCNDGNLDVVSFDFTNVSAKSCNLQSFFIYSIKNNRTFIIQIDETLFKNELTPSNQPIIVPISGTTKVLYREYNGNLSDSSICASPPDASLVRTKEWTATGGTIEITTSAVTSENQTLNSSVIASYNHTIVLKNVSFFTGDSEQKNDIVQFGIYNKPNANKLGVDQTINPKICGTNISFMYKFFGNQTLSLNVDPTIFNSAILNTPKILTTSASNKLIFRVLSNGNTVISDGYFCSNPTPFQNIEEWISQNATGTIQVVTESNAPNGFKHTIKLLNIVMERQNLKFRLGNEYLYGTYIQL